MNMTTEDRWQQAPYSYRTHLIAAEKKIDHIAVHVIVLQRMRTESCTQPFEFSLAMKKTLKWKCSLAPGTIYSRSGDQPGTGTWKEA
jgi:hypothetical protein